MNFSIIIKLLLMHTVHARLGWSSIESIGMSSLVKDSGLVINPDGPLHPLRGYILHKSGHMYNKRLYAPEINTEYGLKKLNKKAVNSAYSYKYTRTPVNDKAYTDICGNRAKNKYLIRLHTQIIRMFPSADGALSIVAGRPDALTSFLIKDEVRPESMYILAAIFLLSEQVNVPIIVDLEEKGNERLVLKSKDGKTTYVDQSLVLNTKNTRKIEKGWNNWHTETVGLINFLKDHMQGKLAQMQKKEGYIEPTTYEQFMTGNFLNTPQFLVQSYIYEFIDTKDKYIEFVEAVYTLLADQIMNKSTPKKKRNFYGKVLNICFIQKGAPSDSINHTAMISDLKKTVNTHKAFPFNSPAEIPEYTRVKAYSRENDEFIDDEEKKYSNCVEAALLGLFCCLLYDPEMREYTTHHIPNKKEAAALKVFFQKYSEPAETADYKMQQEWCRVVAGLNNKNIAYKKEKNEIRSGWINILYVIAEVVGYSPEVLQAIKYMENIRNAKGRSSTLEMQEILTDMFKFLSQNKYVRA
ncbi:hypothetical protein NEIRO03_1781 [Nematocida sp. AWRm78]|nr:hypothetical protein NEIRO02_1645 [Nematocida sp. AWRm79]KAI5184653.1 hypothetical protein NEIRO03_1781 [Nematocida sp. AWRm78]